MGGRVESQSDTEAEMVFGSKFGLLALGRLSPARVLPIRLRMTVSATSPDKVLVVADASKNLGWYLFLTFWPLGFRFFDKGYYRLLTRLCVAAIPLETPGLQSSSSSAQGRSTI